MKSKAKKNASEASFTLFETIIALMIMSTMIIELAGLQGNAIYFSEYGRNMNRAAWLAKRVMSQVEYHYRSGKYEQMELEAKAPIPFEDFKEYSYQLSIQPWKIPFVKMLMGASGSDEQEEDSEGKEKENDAGGLGQFEKLADQVLGKDPFKIAHVEVSWAEGAKRNSLTLTYLLTNLSKLTDSIGLLKTSYDEFVRKESGNKKKKKKKRKKTSTTSSSTGGNVGP